MPRNRERSDEHKRTGRTGPSCASQKTRSTLFEFKHSTNSLKPVLKSIRVRTLAKFAEDTNALLRGHFRPRLRIRGFGFLEAVENPNRFLHQFILSRSGTPQ